MVKGSALPFKVGQLAEARTFEKGYRGAWFRCKIIKIGSRKGRIGQVFVEYLGYEGPVEEWVKLYEIKSPPPPMGEGLTYEFSLEDLRPSLDWSPEYGWNVLTLGGETDQPCARLIRPGDQGQQTEAGKVKAASSPNMSPSSRSSVKSLAASEDLKGNESRELQELSLRNTVLKEVMDAQKTNFILAGGGSNTRKTRSSDTNSTSHSRSTLAEPTTEVSEGHSHPLKKYRANGGMTLNTMHSHTLEAAILDLEELMNKVKWLKSILEHGIPLSNAARPQWEVMEHISSLSMPK